MKKCTRCGLQYAERESQCPHCGFTNAVFKEGNKFATEQQFKDEAERLRKEFESKKNLADKQALDAKNQFKEVVKKFHFDLDKLEADLKLFREKKG